MKRNIIIKTISKNEFAQFKKIFIQTMEQEFGEYSENTRKFFAKPSYIKRIFTYYFRFGGYVDRQLVGYLLESKPYGGVCFISWLGIIRECQRQGVGSKLLARLEQAAFKKGVHNIQFQTDKRNLGFYEKQGYQVIGLDKKSYFGADSYFLSKIIQEPQEKNFLTSTGHQ